MTPGQKNSQSDEAGRLGSQQAKAPAVQLEEILSNARRNEADGAWIRPAIWEWTKVHVRHQAMREAVEQAAALVAEADESPEELFGNARIWAQDRAIEWEKEGAPVFDIAPSFHGRDVVVWGLGTGTGMAVLFFLSGVLTGRWTENFTPGMLLAPGMLGVFCLALGSVWQRVLGAKGFWAAVLVSVLVTGLGTATVVTVFWATHQWRFPGSLLWWLPVVAVYAAAAWGLGRIWPAAPEAEDVPVAAPGDAESMTDEVWLDTARRTLQERNEVTGRRIEDVLAEARSHAQESGASLLEEFGDPRAHALRVPAQNGVRQRRWFWFSLVAALLVLGLLLSRAVPAGGRLEATDWTTLAWFLLLAASAVFRWRSWRAAVKSSGDAGR